jgi:hypothetical protein
MAVIGENLAVGTYYYASRFQLDEGVYSYGGFNGGFWDGVNNISGVLTITPVLITDYPYTQGFESTLFPPAGWAVEDLNGVKTWARTTTNPNSGIAAAFYAYSTTAAADDWLISAGFSMDAGVTYELTYYYRAYNATYAEDMKVMVGTAQNSAGMTVLLADHPGIVNITYESNTVTFSPVETGVYYFGFHCYSGINKWNLYLDDVTVSVVPPVFTVFERSRATDNLPTWFGTSTERGIAWGKVSDGTRAVVDRLLVPSRNGGTKVMIMDDSTGVDLGELVTTGISGGALPINDVEITSDGKILAANVTTNVSTGAFKVYMWNSLDAVPVNIIEYTGANADRLGDNFTVTGSFSDGTAAIYAANATTAAGRVYKWTMTGGVFNATPEIITFSEGSSNSAASVAPLPDGSFYFNALGMSPKKYSAAGTLLGTIPSGIVPIGSSTIKYIGTVDTLEYFATFQYSTSATIYALGKIVAVPVNNIEGAFIFGVTPSLGGTSSGGLGDIAVRMNSDGTANIYVLASNNGFGAYRTNYVIPVELTSFAADVNDRSVILNWSTATEVNTSLFQVERTETDNLNWSAVADVKAFGTTTEKKDYSFTDKNLNSGKYLYRLRIVDFDGSYEYSPAVEAEIGVPVEFSMSQNYPNPFNPSTRINYQVPVDANVTIELFDVTGQKVATFVNQDLKAGYHTLEVSGLRLASGMYIYRMIAVSAETGMNFMDVKKMMMLK